MSNIYWEMKNDKPIEPAMCSITNKKCISPDGYCSICPVARNDPTSTGEE